MGYPCIERMRSFVRVRPLAALSLSALALVALAGCSSSPSGTATPSASATTAVDLCSAGAASGAASDAVTVSGDFGGAVTASFTSPLDIPEFQRTVVITGDGAPLAQGDIVNYAVTTFDPSTGAQTYAASSANSTALPLQLSSSSALGQILGCSPIGSRITAVFPATESTSAEVDVIDVLGVTPAAAWGTPQEPVAGMPTVALDADGAPTVTLPGTDAPTETQVETLKKGDGATVASGDTVLVQYSGSLWSDGTVFDSSWSRGAPASLSTTGVVTGFQKALEGQTVGSQVLVVIPPADGYGDKAQGSIPANSTLVFVIDILATQHAS